MTQTKIQNKAAVVAALYELDQAGALNGLTQAEIARRLGLPNRSKISRCLADVRSVRALIPAILQDWNDQAAENPGAEQPEQPQPEQPGLITTHEAARYLNISVAKYCRLARAGKIPAIRIGQAWRVRRSDLDAWLLERLQRAQNGQKDINDLEKGLN